ncbi:MAG: hypothetical protein HC925_04775 [Coleofasciculaceae cyanobacterium SM2_3_26]|nr:hypothetical protein [Coleofasciculaceae cyanobacterium SM2_3_26]
MGVRRESFEKVAYLPSEFRRVVVAGTGRVLRFTFKIFGDRLCRLNTRHEFVHVPVRGQSDHLGGDSVAELANPPVTGFSPSFNLFHLL